MKTKSLVVLEQFYNNQQERGYVLPHRQSRVGVSVIHLIENRHYTLVPVVLVSRYENDKKTVRTHWLNSLHMPTSNVIASTF